MENKKIIITNSLRNDVISRRKALGISSYFLSEQSGHSKFWLQNIENGKTKKIALSDLLAIYKNLFINENKNEEDIINYLEKLIQRQIGDSQKEWYELINIPEELSDEYDEPTLLNDMQDLLRNDIRDILLEKVYPKGIHQMQAAFTALENLYYSLYINPELTLALISIPVFGVDSKNEEEYSSALNNILSMGAAFGDLAEKNKSYDIIKDIKEQKENLRKQNINTVHNAYDSYNSMLKLISNINSKNDLPLKDILDTFYTSIVSPLNQVEPEIWGTGLPDKDKIKTGNNFFELIQSCNKWFDECKYDYGLAEAFQNENKEDDFIYQKVRNFLSNYGDITEED